MYIRLFCLLAFGSLMVGCNSDNTLYPVTGTVKYADGTIPHGEVAKIRFEPVPQPGEQMTKNPASGTIDAEGKFSLSTVKPNDGAYAGEYKVTLTVLKTYTGRESLINKKYNSANSTTLTATIDAKSPKHFEFILDK